MNSKELQTTDIVTVTTTDATDPSTSSTIADLKTLVSGTSYTPIKWIDGGGEPLSAENLDRFEKSFTALIGNSSASPEDGIIDKLTATLEEEIADRVKDIETIHDRLSESELNIKTAIETESKARIQADATRNERIDKFDTPTTPTTLRPDNGKLQVIKRITIDTTPVNKDDPYVMVETGDISLEEIDIPHISTNKVYVDTDTTTNLTSKLDALDTSDTTINARIDNFQLKNPDASGPQDDDHIVRVNIQDVACDENKLPPNEFGAYNNGTSVISKIYIDPQRSSEGPYVVIEKEHINLVPVDIPMLPPNWIFASTSEEDRNYTLANRLTDIEDRITSLKTNEITANDTDSDGKLKIFSSFKIEDDIVTIETAPIDLTNNDIPANISSDKIDVSRDQTLKDKLESLDQQINQLKSYIASGGVFWQTY